MQVSLLQPRFIIMLSCFAICIMLPKEASAQVAYTDNPLTFSTASYKVVSLQEKPEYGIQTTSFIKAQNRPSNDTNQRRESRITKHFNNDDVLRLWLSINDEQTIDFSMYNLLGKKVKDFGRQTLDVGSDMQLNDFNISDVPNGIYVVVAQGVNFRSAIKITLSRQ